MQFWRKAGAAGAAGRPYCKARFSRDPNEVLAEIRESGALSSSTQDAPVFGRMIPLNPRTGGNALTEAINALQGFDGLPELGDEEAVEAAAAWRGKMHGILGEPQDEEGMMRHGAAGASVLYRYLGPPADDKGNRARAGEFAQAFRSGEFFASRSCRWGSGAYFIPYFGALGEKGDVVIKAALRAEATVARFDHLAREMEHDGYDSAVPTGFNPGYYAACKGYDAYFVYDEDFGNFYTIVLNRTALIVLDTDIVLQ